MYVHTDRTGIKTLRGPGRVERKIADNTEVRPGVNGWTAALLAVCGFADVPLVEVPSPAVTANQIATVTAQLVADIPTQVWTIRAKTADEITAATAAANDTTIRQQADAALTANRTYLQIASPTNAQVAAQVRALTQQNNKLIRLVIGKLDGTD
jgi:hypothetical protein